jgi:hypothetical protein
MEELNANSFSAHHAVAFGLDAARGMDSFVSITLQKNGVEL